jgi:hypothetical protein
MLVKVILKCITKLNKLTQLKEKLRVFLNYKYLNRNNVNTFHLNKKSKIDKVILCNFIRFFKDYR